MGAEEFALRLLQKGPLTFWLPSDDYKLKTGEVGNGGFERRGTNDQQAPLPLNDLISYDEMAISALLNVSTKTPFLQQRRAQHPRASTSAQWASASSASASWSTATWLCRRSRTQLLTVTEARRQGAVPRS